MSTAVSTVGSMMDEMLGDINYSPDSKAGKLYPFFIRVGCVRRRPPRHSFWEYIREMGSSQIDRVLKGYSLDSENLTFVFPERHMGVAEQQAFTHALSQHPDVDKIKSVDIITSSPLIIGGFIREQIRILSWPDDEDYCGGIGNYSGTGV